MTKQIYRAMDQHVPNCYITVEGDRPFSVARITISAPENDKTWIYLSPFQLRCLAKSLEEAANIAELGPLP